MNNERGADKKVADQPGATRGGRGQVPRVLLALSRTLEDREPLYALARNYPAADHFRWITSTAEPAKKVGEKHLNETANCDRNSRSRSG